MTDAIGTSGLVAGGNGELHHPHQARDRAAPGTKYTTQFQVVGATMGQVNTIYLPPLPMNISDAWLMLEVGATSGAGDNDYLIPTIYWANTINLLYRRNTLATLSKAEQVHDFYYNNRNSADHMRRSDLINDVGSTVAQTRAGGSWTYFIPLRRLVDEILGKMGAVSAYAAQSWSLDVDLLPFSRLIRGGDNTAGTATLSEMRVILVGHKEDKQNVDRVVAALEKPGVTLRFEQGNFRRFSYGASAAGATISMPELVGEVTGFSIQQKVATGEDGATGSTVNPYNWQFFNALGDTLAIGTISEPQALFGQALSQRTLRLLSPSDSWSGASCYLGYDAALNQVGAIAIPTEEAGTLGNREGTFSGVLRISHDLVFTFVFSTTTTANYVDIVVFMRRAVALDQTGFGVVNEA